MEEQNTDRSDEVRIIPSSSIEADICYRLISKAEIDQVITYDELSNALGKDVRLFRWVLDTARRRCFYQDRMLFSSVKNIGVKRIEGEAIAGVVRSDLARIRRASVRSIRKTACVRDFDSLAPVAKTSLLTAQSILGVVSMLTKSKSFQKMETRVSDRVTPVSIEETLGIFNVTRQ